VYAVTQQANSWLTNLYSLTNEQDVAPPLREIPHAFDIAKPLLHTLPGICMMRELWGVERVLMDMNQPHILKYDGHMGFKLLHHDKRDITANLCLNCKTSYVGGG
jgi:hypothetical protein